MRKARRQSKIGKSHRGIYGCLNKNEPCRRTESISKSRFVRGIYKLCGHTELSENLPKQAHRTTVDSLGADDSITRSEQGQTKRGGSGEAGRITSAELRSLKRSEPSLQHGHGRISRSAIGVSLVLAYSFLPISCSLINRRQQRAGCRIRRRACMQ